MANESPVVANALQLAVPNTIGLFCDVLGEAQFATFCESVMTTKQGTKLLPLFVAELGVVGPVEDGFYNIPYNIKFHCLNIFNSQNQHTFDSHNQHTFDSHNQHTPDSHNQHTPDSHNQHTPDSHNQHVPDYVINTPDYRISTPDYRISTPDYRISTPDYTNIVILPVFY